MPRKPLPSVPVPPGVAAIKAGLPSTRVEKGVPQKLQKTAVVERSKGTQIRKEAMTAMDHERAKAQHYTDAAKMLREKAVEIRKALAAQKKAAKPAKPAKPAPAPKRADTPQEPKRSEPSAEKAAKKLGVTVPKPGKNPFLHQPEVDRK